MMNLSEDEMRDIGEAMEMISFVARRLRQRALIRMAAVLVFLLIGWFNVLFASGPTAAVAAAVLHHSMALVWWIGFRKYWLAFREARRAVGMLENSIWWERIGDGEAAMEQMEEVSRIANQLEKIRFEI